MNNINDILAGQFDDLLQNNTLRQTPNNSTPITDTTENSKKIEDTLPTQTIPEIKNVKGMDMSTILRMANALRADLDSLIRAIQHTHNGQIPTTEISTPTTNVHIQETGEKVLEGVFNGYSFIGEDGKEYAVPPNYASKSKLIEGDMMKLTVTHSGNFIYKQIGPAKRKHIVGELVYNGDKREWLAHCDGRTYKILTASATFHKGRSGDKVTIIVPESGESAWAAIDNIIHTPHAF